MMLGFVAQSTHRENVEMVFFRIAFVMMIVVGLTTVPNAFLLVDVKHSSGRNFVVYCINSHNFFRESPLGVRRIGISRGAATSAFSVCNESCRSFLGSLPVLYLFELRGESFWRFPVILETISGASLALRGKAIALRSVLLKLGRWLNNFAFPTSLDGYTEFRHGPAPESGL